MSAGVTSTPLLNTQQLCSTPYLKSICAKQALVLALLLSNIKGSKRLSLAAFDEFVAAAAAKIALAALTSSGLHCT